MWLFWGSSLSYLIFNVKMGFNFCFFFGIGLEECRVGLEVVVNNVYNK